VRNMSRKYGKYILVIMGVVLMITFVSPRFSNSGTNANGVRGLLGGKKVTNNDIRIAEFEANLLRSFVTDNPRRYQFLPPDRLLGTRDPNLMWYLLVQEARQNGIAATESEVTGAIQGTGTTEEEFQKFLSDHGSTQRDFRLAVQHELMIRKLAETAMRSVPVSLPQLEYIADQMRSTVQVTYAAQEVGKLFSSKPFEPAEDAINHQFELYKGVLASTGEKEPPLIDGHTYPFGYKWPDRVKVEYVKFDRAGIRSLIKPTQDDVIEAYQTYKADPSRFKTEGPSVTQVGPSTQPKFKPFEDVKAQLIDEQIDARVTKLMRKMTERAQTLAQDAWKDAKLDDKGYYEELPRESWPKFESIATDIQKQREFLGYLPDVYQDGVWRGERDLAELPGIGQAVLQTPREQIAFTRLATRVRALLEKNDPLTRLHLQLGVAGPLLMEVEKNEKGEAKVKSMYLYRVSFAEKSHEPAKVEEVRDQVVRDLKKLSSYEGLKKQAEALATESEHGSLARLAETRGFAVKTTTPFARMEVKYRQVVMYGYPMQLPAGLGMAQVPGLGDVPEFVSAAFGLVAQEKATTQAAGKRVSPIVTLPLDRKLEVFVLSLAKYEPATVDAFNKERGDFERDALMERQEAFQRDWARMEAVAARVKFVPEGDFPQDKGE